MSCDITASCAAGTTTTCWMTGVATPRAYASQRIAITPIVGFGRRLRRLDREQRHEWLRDVERGPLAETRMIVKLLVSAAQLAYYGDDAVMLRLGYDAEANKRRGDELRRGEGRP